MRNSFKSLVIAAMAVVAQAASAGNLVVNGSFESLVPAQHGNVGMVSEGWTIAQGWTAMEWGRGVHTGTMTMGSECKTPSIYSLCYFQQTLNTTPGQAYDINFWLYADGIVTDDGQVVAAAPNGLRVQFGNADVYEVTDFPTTNLPGQNFVPGGPSTLITIHGVQATSDQTLLRFYGIHGFQSMLVDDISVTASAVPEPASLALAGLGLGLVGGAVRRSKRRAA